MTPVEVPRQAEKTIRIRFTQNTSYAGVDYGPDFRAKEAEVRADWARYFIRRGKAVRAATVESPPPTTAGPRPTNSQPVSEWGAMDHAEPTSGNDPISEGFPGASILEAAGITSMDALRGVEDLTAIPGIGKRTAARITAALEESDAGD